MKSRLWQLGVCMLALGAGTLHAADYPSRPIHYISSNGAGSLGDQVARAFAEKISQRLRQPVVVENRPGGGGLVGMNAALAAEPDGHTIFASSSATMSFPALMKDFKLDLGRDVVQVTITVRGRAVAIVNASSPVKTMDELVGHLKANPGTMNVASALAYDLMQVSLFRSVTGTNFEVIRYSGEPAARTALASGEVHFMLASAIPLAKAMADAGKLRFLAVHGTERDPLIAQVPSFGESASPQLKELAKSALFSPWWLGIMVSSKVPANALNALYEATRDSMKDPDLNKRMRDVGVEVLPNALSPRESTAILVNGAQELLRVAKEAGVQPQ